MQESVKRARKKAIVIGTGIGGAGMAAQLAKAGMDVTVFERNSFVGGKTACYEHEGFTMDIAVHTSPRCEKGPIGKLSRRVDADLPWMHQDNILKLIIGKRSCTMPMNFYQPKHLLRIQKAMRFRLDLLSMIGLARLTWRILRTRTIADTKPFCGMTVYHFLKRYIKKGDVNSLMDVLSCLMMVVPAQKASASEFLWNISSWLKDANTGYPKGGYGRIASTLVDICQDYGGVLKLGEDVQRIKVENGAVTGVETENGFYPADIVISNAGYKKTVLDMTGPEHFAPDFSGRAGGLLDSEGGVAVQYAVDKKIIDELVTLYFPENFNADEYLAKIRRGEEADGFYLYIVSPTVVDPELAPEGKHIILACTMVPLELDYKDATERIMNKLESKMNELYPDLELHTLWKVRRNIDFYAELGGRGTAECIGLGQRYDQDGKNKPDPRLPVKGLYSVGADTGGIGIGTELAADSATNVFDIIMDDLRK